MIKLESHILKELVIPKNIAERSMNIAVLKKNNLFSRIEPTEDENILFQKNDAMPRYLEQFLIVDFDRKRSMITEILFDIHKYHPEIFPIRLYLDVARDVFSVITKYRWSGEDAGIVVRLIAVRMRVYRKIDEDFLLSTFQKHDATLFFSTDEILHIIRTCQNDYDIPIHRKCAIHHTMSSGVEDVRYLQKVFRKNFNYFSQLFGEQLLQGFLDEDVNSIVHYEEMTYAYIHIFQKILLNKIDTLNITSDKKIAYKTSVNQEPNLRVILFWSDLLLKRQ
ncbi:MAG: hypothetical protein PHY14_00695 [Candidatus Gracilibacteria bacterium]|nr:hypothetical protein [Candidatus Gracilibacteria bacterium]